MVTYFLHGGVKDKNLQLLAEMSFWPEIMKRINDQTKVLCVYAAIDTARWADEFVREQEKAKHLINDGKIKLNLGSDQPDLLAEQINEAQVIYLRGGYSNELTKSAFLKIYEPRNIFEDKIVAGSSAGAYAVSRYYCDTKGKIGEGLGLVPVKVMAHYTEDRSDDLHKLEKFGEQLPVHALKEDEYVIIEL